MVVSQIHARGTGPSCTSPFPAQIANKSTIRIAYTFWTPFSTRHGQQRQRLFWRIAARANKSLAAFQVPCDSLQGSCRCAPVGPESGVALLTPTAHAMYFRFVVGVLLLHDYAITCSLHRQNSGGAVLPSASCCILGRSRRLWYSGDRGTWRAHPTRA
jgi:hypothetical protein